MRNPALSLRQFCGVRRFQNLYAKYLWGVDINSFRFIGITEKYETSLEIFRRQFDIPQEVTLTIENRNPLRERQNHSLDPELRELIYRANRKDYVLYRTALAINAELEIKFLR